MSMVVIGITGQTGAGKTTALRALRQLGGYLIDCDEVYHQLLESSVPLQQELEENFGSLRNESGAIDRKKLGTIVFSNETALSTLNQITHRHIMAAIGEEIVRAEGQGCPAVAIDAIRLIESGLSQLCQMILAVTASPEVRVERIMRREGITKAYAQSRADAQQDEEFYITHAQYVLNSDGNTAPQLEERARHIFESILTETKGI